MSISCYFQLVLQVMLPSACSFIVDVSCHCLTTHARNNKIKEEKQKWKRAKCDHVQKKGKQPAKQIPSGI
jgi:hypothetical protein